jgi:hypothetical protein
MVKNRQQNPNQQQLKITAQTTKKLKFLASAVQCRWQLNLESPARTVCNTRKERSQAKCPMKDWQNNLKWKTEVIEEKPDSMRASCYV